MASRLEICNMAISHVKGSPIRDINENSQEAESCKTFFQICLDYMFADTEWRFLQSVKQLSEIDIFATRSDIKTRHEYFNLYEGGNNYGDDCAGLHAFAYPSDAMKIIHVIRVPDGYTGIITPDYFMKYDTTDINYKIMQGEKDKIIVSEYDDLLVFYTKKIDDLTQLSPQLAMALSHLLASYIAMPITGGNEATRMKQMNKQEYMTCLASARTHDAGQAKLSKKHSPILDHYNLENH